MACNILLQTGDKLLLQTGDFLLLTNCVVDEFQPLGNKKDYHGGHYNKHKYDDLEQYLGKEIVAVETTVIDLKQREQEARLRQLELTRLADARSKMELARVEAEMAFFRNEILLNQRRLLDLQNQLALLVLSMAYPFLNLGGLKVM